MSKEKLRTKRGITLIALVITIIVMLILVVATVTVALNGGLFKSAKKATADTEIAREEESQLSRGRVQINNVWYDSIEDYITGNESENQGDAVTGPEAWIEEKDASGNITITRGEQTLNIGDYVDYTTDESPDTEWRVLGVEKGRLLLMADSDVGEVTLYGEDWGEKGEGCVEILDEACEYYLNEDYAESIRSIRVEDINNITGYNPLYTGKRNPTQEDIDSDTEHTNRYGSGKVYEYGNKVKYTWSAGSGSKVKYDDNEGIKKNIDQTSNYTTFTMPPDGETLGSEGLTVENTEYDYYPNTLTKNSSGETVGIETTGPAYKMIFENSSGAKESYWLASTCLCGQSNAMWGVHFVLLGRVIYDPVWTSRIGSRDDSYGVRPVVSLKPDIELADGSAVEGQDGVMSYGISNN